MFLVLGLLFMVAAIWFGFQPEEYQQKNLGTVVVYLMSGLGLTMIFLDIVGNHTKPP